MSELGKSLAELLYCTEIAKNMEKLQIIISWKSTLQKKAKPLIELEKQK